MMIVMFRFLKLIIITLAAVVIFTGCASTNTSPSAAPSTAQESSITSESPSATPSSSPSWGYTGATGPENWGSLSESYRSCGTGSQQSPIDLPSLGSDGALNLEIKEGEIEGSSIDTGHTVQFNAKSENTTVISGTEYRLQQLHFHTASEHTVNGKHEPVEFHFLYTDAQNKKLVLAVFGTPGQQNAAFDEYISGMPHGAQNTSSQERVKVSEMLPENRAYWSYDGSLTTPPCTEGVKWVVLATPVQLGQNQIDALTGAYSGNNRPVQPLRSIRSNAG